MTTMFAGAGQQGAFACATAARGTLPGSRRLTVLIETAGAIAHVSLRGTLDTSTAASAYDRIVGSAAAPARRVDVDLTGLEAATRAGSRATRSRRTKGCRGSSWRTGWTEGSGDRWPRSDNSGGLRLDAGNPMLEDALS
jgi:hypothetical protein